jgi:hypothetical protein
MEIPKGCNTNGMVANAYDVEKQGMSGMVATAHNVEKQDMIGNI